MPILSRILLFFLLSMATFSCVPRCTKFPPYIQCHVRMRHYHDGIEFRGVPMHKKQNMQYGEKYSKQQKKDEHQRINTPKNRKRKSKRRVIIRNK